MVILISSKMGGGKTTLTKKLLEKFPQYKVIKFADVLYEIHESVWDVLERYGVPREKKSRDLLQWIGSEFGRKRNPNMWVDCALAKIQDMGLDNVIIDDCRFDNEFDAFAESSEAIIIRLECDREIRKSRAESWTDSDNHMSETGLDAYAKEGYFHLYLDSGVRSADDVFEKVSEMILSGQRPEDDFTTIYDKFYLAKD